MGGQAVLVDPLGRARCRDLDYQAILITHAHVDHLNRWTLSRLRKDVPIYVPKGAARLVADLGFCAVREVEPGDQLAVGHVDVIAVPTRHDPGRWRKGDGPICTGYIVAHGQTVIHHGGDIDVADFDVFDKMGDQFKIDATLLPIGGILPVWYYRWRGRSRDQGVHIDPDWALDIARRLNARTMIPIHYGTVQLPFGPARTAPWRLARMAAQTNAADRVRILRHGESLAVTTRGALPPPRGQST
jgi:L-ascorbate metabolism protein UlaG (beta-lactamase superfamily)